MYVVSTIAAVVVIIELKFLIASLVITHAMHYVTKQQAATTSVGGTYTPVHTRGNSKQEGVGGVGGGWGQQ